jgi:hypothetical protein
MFWVYCAFVATMILLCGWLVLAHEQPASQVAGPYSMSPMGDAVAAAGAAPTASAGAAAGAEQTVGAADYSDAAQPQSGGQ